MARECKAPKFVGPFCYLPKATAVAGWSFYRRLSVFFLFLASCAKLRDPSASQHTSHISLSYRIRYGIDPVLKTPKSVPTMAT